MIACPLKDLRVRSCVAAVDGSVCSPVLIELSTIAAIHGDSSSMLDCRCRRKIITGPRRDTLAFPATRSGRLAVDAIVRLLRALQDFKA